MGVKKKPPPSRSSAGVTRRAVQLVAAGRDRSHADGLGEADQVVGQAGLADAGLAGQQQALATPAARRLEGRPRRRENGHAPHEGIRRQPT